MKKIFVLFTIFFLIGTSCFAGFVSTEAMLQYNRGIDYYKIGQYDQAISAFRSAIRIAPDYIDAYYNLGSVLEYLEQYDAALAVFKQIIVRKPDDYDSVYKAAWLSYKLGENQKAKTYLSIIPPNCARANDAKELAAKLDYTIPTPTKEVKPAVKPAPSINQTSGIYENIAAPTGITSDKEGNVYIAEFNNNTIIKITPDNKRIVYLKDPKISGPIGLAIDGSKNMYIANYNKDNVLKVSSLGEISVLISNVKKPYYLYISGNMLFVSCQGTDSVLRYKLP
ncbi:MAG: tetratricopeptide repeat protein [Candidatus Gastranaerophilales bacterium]|nr:tetratricopeptide repeat protein [Candidatus Gastranaerophilales bacterium]